MKVEKEGSDDEIALISHKLDSKLDKRRKVFKYKFKYFLFLK